mmetsp:Transcript_51238/g.124190  ORF Transcript_51238/g.124190 Transcript_51238/m.124190 type:complete len:297 (-) Transcript_51238:234-1124(-)
MKRMKRRRSFLSMSLIICTSHRIGSDCSWNPWSGLMLLRSISAFHASMSPLMWCSSSSGENTLRCRMGKTSLKPPSNAANCLWTPPTSVMFVTQSAYSPRLDRVTALSLPPGTSSTSGLPGMVKSRHRSDTRHPSSSSSPSSAPSSPPPAAASAWRAARARMLRSAVCRGGSMSAMSSAQSPTPTILLKKGRERGRSTGRWSSKALPMSRPRNAKCDRTLEHPSPSAANGEGKRPWGACTYASSSPPAGSSPPSSAAGVAATIRAAAALSTALTRTGTDVRGTSVHASETCLVTAL